MAFAKCADRTSGDRLWSVPPTWSDVACVVGIGRVLLAGRGRTVCRKIDRVDPHGSLQVVERDVFEAHVELRAELHERPVLVLSPVREVVVLVEDDDRPRLDGA